jgi:multiple sugar transport system permease protein
MTGLTQPLSRIIQPRPALFTRALTYVILISLLALMMAPIAWFLISSLKKAEEYTTYPIVLWPKVLQWGNYLQVFTRVDFLTYATRTAVLGVTQGIILIITSSMGGYAFARFHVPGNKALFPLVMALLLVPGLVFLIPQFILYARLHLTNTYIPWYLGALGASNYFIFMFRQFFYGFPKEIEEAAEIDGCGPFRLYWQIFMPNAKPAIATAFIFAFNSVWGDYLTPLLYLTEQRTLLAVKVATSYIDPKGNALPTVTLAANMVFIIPLIVTFFIGQKYIMKGVVTSGLKG